MTIIMVFKNVMVMMMVEVTVVVEVMMMKVTWFEVRFLNIRGV